MFQVLRVPEMKPPAVRDAIAQFAAVRAQDKKTAIEPQAIAAVCRLFRRFVPYQAMPGRAAGFIAELFDQARQHHEPAITATHVIARFGHQTGLPEQLLRDDLPLQAEEVEQTLRGHIIGQDAACRVISRVVATFKAGLNDPQRPLGTLLFCGPTGVGKTALAKAAANYLFGHGQDTRRLLRLDMSEYSSPWAAERLLCKDGRTPSDFISRVRQQPLLVVLLDEIEKATPEVLDVLLGALDEGRLTDRYGRTTTFRSAIVIMTSNLGAARQSLAGFNLPQAEIFRREVEAFFRPEFFNRIDAVIAFAPLALPACQAIARKELHELGRREGLAAAGLRLDFTDNLVNWLVERGFDQRYGARPLQRTIETQIVAMLSRYMVDHPGLRKQELLLDVDCERDKVVLFI